jgi:tRNA A58 N-methylase Trm61
MSTLNFVITADQTEFDDFANRLGYQAFSVDELDVPIPNPETHNDFLQRILKEKVANTFYTPFVTEIDAQINATRDTDKENMRVAVRDRVGVTFTV